MTEVRVHQLTERRIIEECIAGSRSSQKALYDHFAPKMFGICLRYASDYHSGEDILQEGFIKVFNHLDKFRGDGSFEGWIKRIFINTAIEHYRKSVHLKNYSEFETAAAGQVVSSKAIGHLAKEELMTLVQNLPLGYRTIFNLYAIEGYSHKEISKMLKISEGTSKSQLARARATLKRHLKSIES